MSTEIPSVGSSPVTTPRLLSVPSSDLAAKVDRVSSPIFNRQTQKTAVTFSGVVERSGVKWRLSATYEFSAEPDEDAISFYARKWERELQEHTSDYINLVEKETCQHIENLSSFKLTKKDTSLEISYQTPGNTSQPRSIDKENIPSYIQTLFSLYNVQAIEASQYSSTPDTSFCESGGDVEMVDVSSKPVIAALQYPNYLAAKDYLQRLSVNSPFPQLQASIHNSCYVQSAFYLIAAQKNLGDAILASQDPSNAAFRALLQNFREANGELPLSIQPLEESFSDVVRGQQDDVNQILLDPRMLGNALSVTSYRTNILEAREEQHRGFVESYNRLNESREDQGLPLITTVFPQGQRTASLENLVQGAFSVPGSEDFEQVLVDDNNQQEIRTKITSTETRYQDAPPHLFLSATRVNPLQRIENPQRLTLIQGAHFREGEDEATYSLRAFTRHTANNVGGGHHNVFFSKEENDGSRSYWFYDNPLNLPPTQEYLYSTYDEESGLATYYTRQLDEDTFYALAEEGYTFYYEKTDRN